MIPIRINGRYDKLFSMEVDLEKCPHILVGGATGSGKTYLIKSMLCDILESESVSSRVLVIDPKCVDYQFLNGGIWSEENNYIREVVDENPKGSSLYSSGGGTFDDVGVLDEVRPDGELEVRCKKIAFNDDVWTMRGLALLTREDIESGNVTRWLGHICTEMDRRYKLMMTEGCTKWTDMGGSPIIVVVDELADLIYWDRDKNRSGAGKYGLGRNGIIEQMFIKIATMGRAAGIHLILGTQRPDATVLSGQLRSNISCRICTGVNNTTERRIIMGDSCKDYGDRVMLYDRNYIDIH